MRLVFVVVIGALLVSCAAPTSSLSPSAIAAASGLAEMKECDPFDLRTSQGARLDLTGNWTGGTTVHDVRQIGDCVWWMGRSDWPNEPLGSAWALVFYGHLHPDFTLSGEFVEVYRATNSGGPPGRGFVTFRIEIETVDGAEVVVLRRDNSAQLENQHDDYTADTLRRVE